MDTVHPSSGCDTLESTADTDRTAARITPTETAPGGAHAVPESASASDHESIPEGVPDAIPVASQAALIDAAEAWRRAPALGIDTEFIRTRTYFPKLGLIQISDADSVWLVDPLAVQDLSPLRQVLLAPEVVKVFHSCAEDLEVLSWLCGKAPAPVFDTQIAGSFTGHGMQPSYQQIVSELYGRQLEKDATRSDWLKRPLSPAQLAYAALDVVYLIPMYEQQSRRLAARGRLDWVLEECCRAVDRALEGTEPETRYLFSGGIHDMDRRSLAVMRALTAWRERRAQARDLPRNFILTDKSLRALARSKPRSLRGLSVVEGLSPSFVRKFGKALTGLIRETMELPEDQLPPALPRPVSSRKAGRAVRSLRDKVEAIAADLELPPELVARKKLVAELVRAAMRGELDPLPLELAGWRCKPVAEPLLAELKRLL